jgi:hypothetical protein
VGSRYNLPGPGRLEGVPGADCVGLSVSVLSNIILVVIWRVDALAASGHLAYGALFFVSLNFLTAARNRCRRLCVWSIFRHLPYRNVLFAYPLEANVFVTLPL